ncbi:MAG: phosphate starvation-inducible protein PhoH [Alphaproteobacteria bacterium]|nr:phosphate starvation-inducible protein PhoH [Alphaproteobacteria bacterium]
MSFADNRALARLVGLHSRNLSELERALDVTIAHRGNRMQVSGSPEAIARAARALNALYERAERGSEIGAEDVRMELAFQQDDAAAPRDAVRTRRGVIEARTPNQAIYLNAMRQHELTFGIGPAGTGKTYLAVAMAVSALLSGQVRRLILSRPAVEAGEKLGFLPGDMKEKVDPYLRPLYDALFDMLPGEQVQRWLETGDIEIAPLAFMRGRTLAHAFVILDEAQNATPAQMRMFLTRLGEGSTMVVTGDPTQSDLAPGQISGLAEATRVLEGEEGVGLVRFADVDIVRHALVTRIVRAYAAHDAAAPARKPRHA